MYPLGGTMELLYDRWANKLKKTIENRSYDEAVSHLVSGINIAFSSPRLYDLYNDIVLIPEEYFNDVTSKLIYGWICFANGDNIRLNWVMSAINDEQLELPEDKSSYYSLKAMTSFLISKEEGLKYGKLAIAVLPENNESMMKGNAYMTYARQLAFLKKYREAAQYFEKSYKVFKRNQCSFLAITCFVNECLNLYTLGKYEKVINKSNEVLKLGTSIQYEIPIYMELIKLPMGMCYYEINKTTIAKKVLYEAKRAIDNLNLPYLHGLLEIYLFKIYNVINEDDKMANLIEYLEEIFKNMHHKEIKYLIIAFKIKHALSVNKKVKKEWIEELELAFHLKKQELSFFIIETLTQLRINKLSEAITIDFLRNHAVQLRTEGNVADLQSVLIYIAEIYYIDNNNDKARHYFKGAYSIYQDYKAKIKFLDKDLKCFKLLKDIDSAFYRTINSKKQEEIASKKTDQLFENLTSREIEILQIMAEGKSNKEIAENLFISVGTVKWHINNIYSKLYVKKRFDAIEKSKSLRLI